MQVRVVVGVSCVNSVTDPSYLLWVPSPFVVLGIKPRPLNTLGKHPTTKLYTTSPSFFLNTRKCERVQNPLNDK